MNTEFLKYIENGIDLHNANRKIVDKIESECSHCPHALCDEMDELLGIMIEKMTEYKENRDDVPKSKGKTLKVIWKEQWESS